MGYFFRLEEVYRGLFCNFCRFTVVDKRNRNLIRKLLEIPSAPPPPPGQTTDAAPSAEEKARSFYKSCVVKDDLSDRRNLQDLAALVESAGGWTLTGAKKNSVNGRVGKCPNCS